MEGITPTLRLRISSRCESEDEFVTLFHPLSVGRVVFLPTSHPEVVDPHAAGLATAGKRGMALRFDRLSDTSEVILRELHRPPPGTIPFGVPTGTSEVDRMVCEVQRLPDPPNLPGVTPAPEPPGEDTVLSSPAAPAPGDETLPSSPPAPPQDVRTEPSRPAAPRVPVAVASDPEISRGPRSVPDILPAPRSAPPDIPPPRNTPNIGPPRSVPTGELKPIAWTDDGAADDLTDVVSPPVDDPLPSIIASEPGALTTPEPLLPALPPMQPPPAPVDSKGTSTEVLRSNARSRTVAIALVAACLGVAGGWLLWKRNRPEAAAASATVADHKKNTAAMIAEDTLEPTEPPVAAIAGDCRAEIASVPEGAAVFLDQTLLGATPYEGPVPCGRAQVTLTLPSYQTEARGISPSEDDPTEIELELQRVKHALRIVGTPRKAMVTVDGERRGRLPVTVQLPAGSSAMVEVDKRGYKMHKVKVVADERQKIVKVRLRKR